MSTMTPSADASKVPVKFKFEVITAETKETIENLTDHRHVLDTAAARLKAVTDAAGPGSTVKGTLTIGSQKIKL